MMLLLKIEASKFNKETAVSPCRQSWLSKQSSSTAACAQEDSQQGMQQRLPALASPTGPREPSAQWQSRHKRRSLCIVSTLL